MKPQIEYAPGWWERLSGLSAGWRRWWGRRDRRYLVMGLPALLLMLVVLALIVFVTPSRGELEKNYLQEGMRRRDRDENYDGADLCFKRLALMGITSPELAFNWAKNQLEKAEKERDKNPGVVVDTSRALQTMDELAPDDRYGYAPAHVWQARRLKEKPGASVQDLEKAERHLGRALGTKDFNDPEAEALLGEICVWLALNDRDHPDTIIARKQQAVYWLERAVKRRPETKLWLAKAYAVQGVKNDLVRQLAQEVIQTNEGKLLANDNDHKARRDKADALIFLGHFAEAEELLLAGLKMKDGPKYRKALCRMYIDWANALAHEPTATPGDQWDKLQKALLYDPENREVIQALFAMIQSPDKNIPYQVRTMLREMVTNGKAVGLASLFLGIDALNTNDPKTAERLLSQALTAEPTLTDAAVVLVQLLLNKKKIADAGKVIDAAIAHSPNDPRLRRWRAKVFANAAPPNWNKALGDLLFALKTQAEDPSLQKDLAEVYNHLDQKEQADRHKKKAEELEAKRKERAR